MSKCLGCGSTLTNDPNMIGYTKNLDNKLCERCFRIRHYNEYKTVTKDNKEYYKILDNIDDGIIALVVDVFDIPENLNDLIKHLKQDIILVLTKYDLIPSNYDEKFINYFKNNYNINPIDYIVVSSKKNYNIDCLYDKIKKYYDNKVYFVGYTNAGKSSLINKLIYNYSDNKTLITTSTLPSTTLNTIEIKLNNLTLIDTPGIIDNNSLTNLVDGNYLKKIIPSNRIKPITYQIKTKQCIVIEDWFKINCENPNNLVFYFSNFLNIQRYYKDVDLLDLKKEKITVDQDTDIVIPGAGFIHVLSSDTFDIFVKNGVKCYIRNSIM